jgi:hypothetical protein
VSCWWGRSSLGSTQRSTLTKADIPVNIIYWIMIPHSIIYLVQNVGAMTLHPWTMRPWTICPCKNWMKRPWDEASLGICFPMTFCHLLFCDNMSPFFGTDHPSILTHHPGDASSQGRIIQGCIIQGRIVQGRIVMTPRMCENSAGCVRRKRQKMQPFAW